MWISLADGTLVNLAQYARIDIEPDRQARLPIFLLRALAGRSHEAPAILCDGTREECQLARRTLLRFLSGGFADGTLGGASLPELIARQREDDLALGRVSVASPSDATAAAGARGTATVPDPRHSP